MPLARAVRAIGAIDPDNRVTIAQLGEVESPPCRPLARADSRLLAAAGGDAVAGGLGL